MSTFVFTNLDPDTRAFMRQEVARDVAASVLYTSPRLSTTGAASYENLLLDAVDNGDTLTFIAELSRPGVLNDTETANRNGKQHTKKVPVNAAQTLAEGEFNRFYARGLCARAITEEAPSVRIYRAKAVTSPRSESLQLIGQLLDPAQLLTDLRANIGMDVALRLPPGPNSGLSIELP